MKRFAILILCIAMSINLCGCGKGKRVEAAEAAIEAIGEVTLESGEAIEAARTAYDALKPRQQEKVENYAVLTDAEAVFGTETAIDAIGEVTIDSGDAVEEARNAYDALTPEQQKMVKSLDILTTAEEEFEFAELYEANKIKNYKDTGYTEKVGKSCEEIYDNDSTGALCYVYIIFTDGVVDRVGVDVDIWICYPYIGINAENKRIDFYVEYDDGILGVQYWPETGKKCYGTVQTELEINEYMQMLEHEETIDEYHLIDNYCMYNAIETFIDYLNQK